jgi:prenyltransferase beta subunit
MVHAQEKEIKQSIAYLQKLQTDSGGFRAYDPGPKLIEVPPTLRATSAAIRALGYLGGDISKKDACVKFVESCWDAEAGGFANEPKAKPDVFSTAVGLMAVTELRMSADKYADACNKYLTKHAKSFDDIRIAAAGLERAEAKSPKQKDWLKEVEAMATPDGTFGKGDGTARDTASAIVTILRIGASEPGADRTKAWLKVLKAGQRQDGGWGKTDGKASDLESSYRVMRCFVMLKARPDNVDGLRAFIAKCRNADGGYGSAPGQSSTAADTYFAAIITHWLKQ